ncbi:hypothetical protein [Thermosulfuriphilus sp.]
MARYRFYLYEFGLPYESRLRRILKAVVVACAIIIYLGTIFPDSRLSWVRYLQGVNFTRAGAPVRHGLEEINRRLPHFDLSSIGYLLPWRR